MIPWEPREYQLEGVKHLLETANAGLWFDPGMGKTAVTLAALKVLKMRGMLRRALVVAPVRVATEVWRDEQKKWSDFKDLSVSVLHGPHKDAFLKFIVSRHTNPDIVTVSPDGLLWLTEGESQRLYDLDADVLIIDESSYFRHQNTKRFRNLRPHLHRFRRRITLTGTPAPRGYEDLWAQAYIMDMGGALERFISHYRFKYFVDIGRDFSDWRVRPECVPLINDKLKPFVLRGDALGNVPLPELLLNTIKVKLPNGAVADSYRRMEADFIASFDQEEVMSPTTATLANKLRQIASGFIYNGAHVPIVLHNEKINAVIALLNELQGKRALILYEYLPTRDQLLTAMHKHGGAVADVATLDSGKTADILRGFNDGAHHLLAHPAAIGHGLNLQEHSQHVVWVGPTWDLELHEQAIKRVWRQGNKNATVTVHTIVAEGTKDEVVVGVLQEKNSTQKSLLAAMKR